MPTKPKKPCNKAGCTAVTDQSYCPRHQLEKSKQRYNKQYERQRGTASQRGYDATWQRLRKMVLNANPLCRSCQRDGMATPATEVDHIVPINRGGERLDRKNLQALCKSCHSKKTVREDGGFGRGGGVKSL